MKNFLAIITFLNLTTALAFEGFDIPGTADVNAAGGASYTIPIEIPKGPGGFQPSLSLRYDSHGANGPLGLGWSLGGLSTITRCPGNLIQDSKVRPVRLDSRDLLCLDGKKLLHIGWSPTDEMEYRFEIENFTRIFAVGGANGPDSFKVYTKDGLLLGYGQTAESKSIVSTNPQALAWNLTSVRDLNGNYYEIDYQNDLTTGESIPFRIRYGLNDQVGQGPIFSVTFEYEQRPDPIRVYRSNARFVNTLRVLAIRTYYQSTQILKYTIGYNQSGRTGRSLITSIGVSDASGSRSLLPTQFDWNSSVVPYTQNNFFPESQPGMSVNVPAIHEAGGSGGVGGSGVHNIASTQWIAGDFNGDGIDDFIQPGTGRNSVPVCFGRNDGTSGFRCTNWALGFTLATTGNFISSDFDGDGLADFALVNTMVPAD